MCWGWCPPVRKGLGSWGGWDSQALLGLCFLIGKGLMGPAPPHGGEAEGVKVQEAPGPRLQLAPYSSTMQFLSVPLGLGLNWHLPQSVSERLLQRLSCSMMASYRETAPARPSARWMKHGPCLVRPDDLGTQGHGQVGGML